jgi:hypothetical protein
VVAVTHQQNPLPPGAPGVPKSRKNSGLLLGVTLVVAVLGLVVGVAGVALASMALGRSDRAVSLAGSVHSAPPPPAPTGSDPTGPAPTSAAPSKPTTGSTGGADPSATPTEIDPSAQFSVAYQGQHLRIRSVGCGYSNSTNVDLDEPRILGTQDKGAEFGYNNCDPGQVESALPFAQVSGPTATPADCLETIRTDPGRSPIAPAAKMTLCFLTSQEAAADQGISQKLVFVTVDSVTVDNRIGVLNVTAKAWTVPN